MNNSNEFFLKKMKGVNPIKKNNRIKKEKPNIKIGTTVKKTTIIKQDSFLTKYESVDKKSIFDLENINIKKNLKKKLFKIDKKIDFHGLNLIESEELFFSTVTDCYNGGLRCLLFVTGKGLFKAKKIDIDAPPKLYHGIIRREFVSWVTSNKFSRKILSYEKASIEHGGDGAFFVYLRKKKT